MDGADTICAISTPAGEGGIGIVRLTGDKSLPILRAIFRAGKGGLPGFDSHRLTFGRIADPESGDYIDEVFAVFLAGPRTYTCEDMVEIHCHGNPGIMKRILTIALNQGCRLAEPGEFTKRAYLNGRIDLIQAEAVLSLIHSETDEEATQALHALSGELSRRIGDIQQKLRSVLAGTEALIDFPDDDIDTDLEAYIPVLRDLSGDISCLVESFYEGRLVTDGIEVLIVGRTNVGKSSLLNALVGKDRAIVTAVAGTTRDLIEETIVVDGVKIRLVDTAGLREPHDIVEAAGIDRVMGRIKQADLVLWVIDNSQPFSKEDWKILDLLGAVPVLIVVNKVDLPSALDRGALDTTGLGFRETSAREQIGIESLRHAIREAAGGVKTHQTAVLITNVRHRDALARTGQSIGQALRSIDDRQPLEFVALEIREALAALGEVAGETLPEQTLQEIFSTFCIGK